jgi:hypothetical protein
MLRSSLPCSRRTMHPGRLLLRLVIAQLAFGLVMLAPGGSQMTQVLAQGALPNATADERLDAMFDRLAELRESIDRATFDVEALAFEMAFEDADTIIDWVRGAIAFEQYAGVLRGPEGTLMARAGNAYDQAVLLATLLKGAGYDARIAEGALDREGAEALLAELGQPIASAPAGIDVAAATEAIAELMVLAGVNASGAASVSAALAVPADLESEAEPVLSAVAADTERLLGLLEAAGVSIGDAALADELLEEARAYAWVEYRLGSGDAWRAAHPAFGVGRGTPASLETVRTFEDVVPDDLLHRVRIESLLESRRGSSLVTTDLMTAWERPSAAIVGEAITYMNVPGSMLTEPDASTDERFAANETFFPTLLGTFAPGAQAFDTLGIAVPLDVALNPAAGVFRSAAASGARGAEALGGIGGGSEDAAGLSFERHLLRFSIVSPNGAATTVERVVAEHEEDPVAVARALAQRLTLMVDVGAAPASYLLDRQLARILELRPLLSAMANGAITDQASTGDGAVFEGVDFAWSGHTLLTAAAAARRAGTPARSGRWRSPAAGP